MFLSNLQGGFLVRSTVRLFSRAHMRTNTAICFGRVSFFRDSLFVLHDLQSPSQLSCVCARSAERRVSFWKGAKCAQTHVSWEAPCAGLILLHHLAGLGECRGTRYGEELRLGWWT